jgi:hypothetical protein
VQVSIPFRGPRSAPEGAGMPLRGTGGFDTAQPGGAGRDNAALPEPTLSPENCLPLGVHTLRSGAVLGSFDCKILKVATQAIAKDRILHLQSSEFSALNLCRSFLCSKRRCHDAENKLTQLLVATRRNLQWEIPQLPLLCVHSRSQQG